MARANGANGQVSMVWGGKEFLQLDDAPGGNAHGRDRLLRARPVTPRQRGHAAPGVALCLCRRLLCCLQRQGMPGDGGTDQQLQKMPSFHMNLPQVSAGRAMNSMSA